MREGSPAARAIALSAHLRRPADRDPRAGRRLRRALAQGGRVGAREAHCARATDRRRLAAPRRGRARRYNLARLKAGWNGEEPRRSLRFTEGRCATASSPPGLKLAVFPEHRLFHRRRAERTRPTAPRPRRAALVHRPAHRRLRRPRGPRHRALRRLRHQDRRRRHARLPEPRVPGRRQGLHAGRPAGEDQPLRRRRRRRAAAVQARRHALGHAEGARPPRRAGAGGGAAEPLRRAQAPRAATPSRVPTETGSASSRRRSRTARRPTSATRSTSSWPTWRPRARWTAWSAATSATARPRSRCAPPSRRRRTASRC